MTHLPNLRILAFVGKEAEDVVDYLTEKGFPKVSDNDMASQIEHLSMAGQHRIITSEIVDEESYQRLKNTFPGEVQLIAIGSREDTSSVHPFSHVDYTISSDKDQIEALLEELRFTLN